jgi:hypothetical protein
VKKYISVLPSPPRLEEQTQGKVEPKSKECCEVSEGDDDIIIEDSSDDENEETLQQRFQLRSRFSQAGIPNIPVNVKPSSLEDSLPVPPRKLRNVAQKRTVRKLKLSKLSYFCIYFLDMFLSPPCCACKITENKCGGEE